MTERASQATPVTRVCLGYLVSDLHAVEVGCGCLRGCLHAAWPGERGQRRASGLGWGAVGGQSNPPWGVCLGLAALGHVAHVRIYLAVCWCADDPVAARVSACDPVGVLSERVSGAVGGRRRQ